MTDPKEKMDPVKPSAQGHDIKKPGAGQELMPEFLRMQEQVREERRQAERRVAQERERATYEITKVRQEAEKRVSDVLQESRTLLRTLARLQTEKEALESEVMLLRAKLSVHHENGHPPQVQARPVAAGIPVIQADPDKRGPLAVPTAPGSGGFTPLQQPTPHAPAGSDR